VHEISQKMGIGAQFGGKYFCHDVRVVRLPRHGASCPVGIGVSCSADRQAKAKITKVQAHTGMCIQIQISHAATHDEQITKVQAHTRTCVHRV
jgi:tartrate dehydratase alpha subunit/fumarate hydratase class I-like protein